MAVFSSKKVEKVQKKKAAPSSDRSYQLKNSAKKIYFKGAVLSKNSSDADWIAFIKYPKEAKKVKARKELFVKLPIGLEPKKSEPKTEEATPATAQGSQAAEVSKEDTAQ